MYVCHGGPSNVCDTLIGDLGRLEGSCTLVYWDYRGSGGSAAAPADTYRFDRIADDLDELRRHLGHTAVSVLAHSMGGFVGLHYALRHPATCERLALVAATPCGATGPMAIPALRALGPARTARALAVALWYLVAWSWRAPSTRRTRAMYAPMAVAQEARPELRAAVAQARSGLPVDNDNATHLLRAMGSLDMRNELGRISCPVLVLYGSRDAVMVAGGQMLASGLRDPEVHVLDGVGHEPFIEQPDTTFSMLESFLGAGRARGP